MSAGFSLSRKIFSRPIKGKKKTEFLYKSEIRMSNVSPVFVSIDKNVLKSVTIINLISFFLISTLF